MAAELGGERYVAFDVGSNTTRGLAALLSPEGDLAVERAAHRMTALGRGLSGTRRLEAAALEATADFAGEFLRDAQPWRGAWAVATAAAREATNSDELVRAFSALGVSLQILGGEEEARLAWQGALAALPGAPGEAVVVDVGGRSTEVVRGRGGEPAALSLALGARSLTEGYLPGERPTTTQAERASQFAREQLQPAAELLREAPLVVAAGGTASTLAVLLGGVAQADRDDLTATFSHLCALPLSRRREALGFDPARAEVFCGGLLLLEAVLELSGRPELQLSLGGVREGLLLERTGARRLLATERLAGEALD